MGTIKFCCPCHFGLESVLKFEAGKIGGENVCAEDGKVCFEGDFETLAAANLWLRTAERVLIVMGSFEAQSFEELFQGVKGIAWEDYIAPNDAFPVKAGHSLNSKLSSIPDCQAIIKKAIVERLKTKYGVSWFAETDAPRTVRFSIIKDTVSIWLDTSGDGLHKRGYRRRSNAAPIKETLAAGIIDFARVKVDTELCDPMCGSGTFLIEGAYRALSVAPGIRRRFAAERWQQIPSDIWQKKRNEAKEAINKGGKFRAFGFDIDPDCADLSLDNARKAGVASRINVQQADAAKFVRRENSIVICNPPYGERLMEIRQAEELYKMLGQRLCPDKQHPCYIISPHEDFEKFFGKKADKRRKLYNGMIKCQLYMYYL